MEVGAFAAELAPVSILAFVCERDFGKAVPLSTSDTFSVSALDRAFDGTSGAFLVVGEVSLAPYFPLSTSSLFAGFGAGVGAALPDGFSSPFLGVGLGGGAGGAAFRLSSTPTI